MERCKQIPKLTEQNNRPHDFMSTLDILLLKAIDFWDFLLVHEIKIVSKHPSLPLRQSKLGWLVALVLPGDWTLPPGYPGQEQELHSSHWGRGGHLPTCRGTQRDDERCSSGRLFKRSCAFCFGWEFSQVTFVDRHFWRTPIHGCLYAYFGLRVKGAER